MAKLRHKKSKSAAFAISLIVLIVAVIASIAILWQKTYKENYLKAMYPQKYSELVVKYADENGLDPNLVFAVIKCESGFDPQAHSSVDARGLMQLQPDSYKWVKTKLKDKDGSTEDDLYTPEVNIKYGTKMLSQLIGDFKDEETAIAAYHAGRTSVKKWLANAQYSHDGKALYYIPYASTRAYVLKVEKSKKIYAELYKET